MFNESIDSRDSVLQHLRAEIHGKKLPSGTQIDPADLASKLGVSTDVVREAVSGLKEEGLVETSADGQQRVVVMTKRLAQELIDLLGLLLVSAVDRLPEDFQENAPVVTAAKDFSAAVLQGQPNSENAFRTLAETFFAGSGNGELQRVGLPVIDRAMSILRLYDSTDLLPMWADAFEQLPEVLESSPKEAARHMRVFFVYLVNEIEYSDAFSETQ